MDNPKVSVLIPMYNRKHYISQCLDSALNQTFKEDYEIIVRDDGSTDGSYDFVAEKYADQIATGKIKLHRNKTNIGEFPTDARLLKDSTGKYIMILHSDDMYMPHAIQHLYEVAEKTNADVVHSSLLLLSPKSGIINDLKDCKVHSWERNIFDEVTIMPQDPLFRFNEWINSGTGIDAQYNIFNREFIVENDLSFGTFGNRYLALWWLMTAKIFVKTPVICYVYRNAPDSTTNDVAFSSEKLEKTILNRIEMIRSMDKNFAKIDFFKNNEYFQYIAKAHLSFVLDNFGLTRSGFYANGITPEIYQTVSQVFKKIFGENYFYPMFLFNWTHVVPYNKRVDAISTPPPFPGRRYNLILAA